MFKLASTKICCKTEGTIQDDTKVYMNNVPSGGFLFLQGNKQSFCAATATDVVNCGCESPCVLTIIGRNRRGNSYTVSQLLKVRDGYLSISAFYKHPGETSHPTQPITRCTGVWRSLGPIWWWWGSKSLKDTLSSLLFPVMSNKQWPTQH